MAASEYEAFGVNTSGTERMYEPCKPAQATLQNLLAQVLRSGDAGHWKTLSYALVQALETEYGVDPAEE